MTDRTFHNDTQNRNQSNNMYYNKADDDWSGKERRMPARYSIINFLDGDLHKIFVCMAGRQAVFLLHCSLAAASEEKAKGTSAATRSAPG